MATTNLVGFNRKLSALLQRHELVGADELKDLSSRSAKEGKSLGELLIEEDYLDEPTLTGLVSEDVGMPPIDLVKYHVDMELLCALNRGEEPICEADAKRFGIVPVAMCGEHLTVAVSNPYDVVHLDDIKLHLGMQIIPVVSTDRAINKAIEVSYHAQEKAISTFLDTIEDDGEVMVTERDGGDQGDEEGMDDLLSSTAEGSPAVKLVNMVILQAIQRGASDIHIEPFEKRLRVRYRIDGVLHEVLNPPKRLENGVVSRIKIMTDTMNIAERGKPQDGRFQVKIAGRAVDFRVSSLPTVHGEKMCMRILDKGNLAGSLDSLGFEPGVLDIVARSIASPYGMFLVTGPTGSGKSTTLYSCLQAVMGIEDNVTTVEEPVEYEIEGLNQVHVNPKRGLTFASALRAILRQDPDTVMIGEIRDQETIEIAVKAALTGHLVLSTLHTNDAPSTINRIVDMGIEPFLVANTVLAISAQRLGRRLCKACKRLTETMPTPDQLITLGYREEEIEGLELWEPVGCSLCANGYKGRFALVECLEITDPIREIIITGGSNIDIRRVALQDGMVSLRRAGLMNAMRGVTSVEEVTRVTMADETS
ncbi:MAG: ATPase, T2SS/T4P/T4SS family [Planctomycetota bacterium]|jgi:type IV pilus assembly protein PilB|nr:ATPase, T2SS/T4P/T4SS family [Planctomycetota bacterium]